LASSSRSTAAHRSESLTRRPKIVRLIEPQESEAHVATFAEAVRAGLTAEPKSLPWTYFYDEAGSRLFEAICELPEYYLTRIEDVILRDAAAAMVDCLEPSPDEEATIVELGSGSAVKTQRLITAGLKRYDRLHYVPIDVSPSALEDSARRLAGRFPSLRVTGYVADYRRGLERITARSKGPRLIVFLGSSLGNYDMGPSAELLAAVARTMRPQDRLLLGTDLAKDKDVLEAAYDDAQGVTAAFDLNLLHRINRELSADFRVESFAHRATYRPDRGRVESHLVSMREQSVHIPAAGLTVRFLRGETMHTENSHKYTLGMLASLADAAGFAEEADWTDDRGWFRVQRWRLREGCQVQ
jgi:L-histidine N-alpha-methyltransferase